MPSGLAWESEPLASFVLSEALISLSSMVLDSAYESRIHRRPKSKRKLRAVGESSVSSAENGHETRGKGPAEEGYSAQIVRQEQRLEWFLLPRPCRLVVERVNSLASQLGLRKTPSSDLGHEKGKTVGIVQRVVLGSAIGITEHLFVKVTVKMKWFDSNVCAAQIALEQAPEVFQSVCMDLPVDVPLGMVNEFMHEAVVQQVIGHSIVRVNLRTIAHILQDFILQGLALHVGNDLTANLPQIAVKNTLHSRLAEIQISKPILAANLPQFHFAALVHIDSLATYECFIGFNGTAGATQLEDGFVLHCFTNPVEHEPCRGLHDSKCPSEFIAADSVLTVRKHPNRNHPLIKAERRILKDGSNLERELLLTDVTEPQTAGLDERVLGIAAAWTGDLAVRPAQFKGGVESVLRVAVEHHRFLQGVRYLHESNTTLRTHVCQAFYCRCGKEGLATG